MELTSLWFFVMHYATSVEVQKLKGLPRDKTGKISHSELPVHLIFLYVYGFKLPGYFTKKAFSKLLCQIQRYYKR